MSAEGGVRRAGRDSSATPIFDGLLAEVGMSWPGREAAADGDPRDDGPAGWFEPNAGTGPAG